MSLWSFSVEGALLVLALVLGEAHCGVGRDRGPVSHSRDKDAMEGGACSKNPSLDLPLMRALSFLIP